MKNQFVVILASATLVSCSMFQNQQSALKLFPLKSGDDFEYVDREGKIQINPQFSNASVFRDNLALVSTSGEKKLWGFIDESGTYVIPANYKEATIFREGLAWVVSENAAPSAIDTKGEIIFTLQNAQQVKPFYDGLASFSEINDEDQEEWGFVNKEGQIAISPQFNAVGEFSEGLCPIMNDQEEWGYIGKDGKIVINHQFDDAKTFSDGVAVVANEDKYGVIDKKGKYIINPQYSSVAADGDYFLVRQDDNYGWIDRTGKVVVNPQFTGAWPFKGSDLAAAKSGDNWGYVNREGKFEINPQFDMALPFNGNLALVQSGERIGFVDTEGKYVINPQFDDISLDLFAHLVSGKTAFGEVETDYFDIGSVVNAVSKRVTTESFFDFTAQSTFGDLAEQYKITESDFERYSNEHQVSETVNVSRDASYTLHVLGKPWNQVKVKRGSGWFGYYDYETVFDRDAKPTGLALAIQLTGKGKDKGALLVKALKSSLSQFDAEEKEEGIWTLKSNELEIELKERNGYILLICETLANPLEEVKASTSVSQL